MTTIPHARGLVEELSTRVQDLIVGQPTEEMAPDGIHKVIQYEVFAGVRRLGVVEVNSWNFNGVTQIDHVTYEGVVPGYNEGRVIGMTATAKYNLSDVFDTPHFGLNDNTKPNNTPEKPLYRHDGHPLQLADYEVPGKEKHRIIEMERVVEREERQRLGLEELKRRQWELGIQSRR